MGTDSSNCFFFAFDSFLSGGYITIDGTSYCESFEETEETHAFSIGGSSSSWSPDTTAIPSSAPTNVWTTFDTTTMEPTDSGCTDYIITLETQTYGNEVGWNIQGTNCAGAEGR